MALSCSKTHSDIKYSLNRDPVKVFFSFSFSQVQPCNGRNLWLEKKKRRVLPSFTEFWFWNFFFRSRWIGADGWRRRRRSLRRRWVIDWLFFQHVHRHEVFWKQKCSRNVFVFSQFFADRPINKKKEEFGGAKKEQGKNNDEPGYFISTHSSVFSSRLRFVSFLFFLFSYFFSLKTALKTHLAFIVSASARLMTSSPPDASFEVSRDRSPFVAYLLSEATAIKNYLSKPGRPQLNLLKLGLTQ